MNCAGDFGYGTPGLHAYNLEHASVDTGQLRRTLEAMGEPITVTGVETARVVHCAMVEERRWKMIEVYFWH
jgi:hypothetical protein